MSSDMLSYYKNRAQEYEKVYLKHERQKDLLQLTHILQGAFKDKEVFEIACGTGYRTGRIAKSAKAIKAINVNEAVLELAKAKIYFPAKLTFEKLDIFQLPNGIQCNSLFGGFIWSYIKLQDLSGFIDRVGRQVEKGGTIVFIDNNYVEGSSLPITDQDSFGSTYQTRNLEDDSTYKVVKNFPSKTFIEGLLKDRANDIDFIDLEYYWMVQFRRKT